MLTVMDHMFILRIAHDIFYLYIYYVDSGFTLDSRSLAFPSSEAKCLDRLYALL